MLVYITFLFSQQLGNYLELFIYYRLSYKKFLRKPVLEHFLPKTFSIKIKKLKKKR